MRQRDLSYGSKIFLFFLLIASSSAGFSQRIGPPKSSGLESFLDTQFWLGLRFGASATSVRVGDRFSGFSPINYHADSLSKAYENYSLPAAQVGLEINLYHRGFSVSLQPAYKRSRIEYGNTLGWESADPDNRIATTYQIEQRIDILELPLMFKFDVIRKGRIRPFLMAGGFHSIILSAQRDTRLSETSFSAGTPITIQAGSTTVGTKNHFTAFSGWSAGAGVNLDYWNIRTVFEIGYKHALTAATNGNIRQNELASLGEADDELFLRDINISLGFVFPFRFIGSGLKAY